MNVRNNYIWNIIDLYLDAILNFNIDYGDDLLYNNIDNITKRINNE